MTIKEFARLCSCNPQTLRYYDKIDLLKPAKVDSWTGYRSYEPEQAVDFVKIKNLQAADFSIQEIKALLTQPDARLLAAFDAKIATEYQKLSRMQEIKEAYLRELSTMEQIIHSMTDYLLSQCSHPEVLTEFGFTAADAPTILAQLRSCLNSTIHTADAREEITMTVNDEVIRGENAVLERVRSLTKENLSDSILLDDGRGHSTDLNGSPEPDFADWELLWEKTGWAHVSDFLNDLPRLEQGKQYALWIRQPDTGYDDLSFPLFLIGAILHMQQITDIPINCAMTADEHAETLFKLYCK